jgi:ABC-type Na+ efflux pump permease subunit
VTSFVAATALKDLRARLRDPLAFLLWLGIPLAIGGLLTLGMGGSSGPKPRAPLYFVDRDETFVSKALASAFGQGALADLFDLRRVDEAQARAKLANDDGTALIVVPKGFTRALIDDAPTTLEVVENPAQRILPGIVEQTLSILPDAAFYLHQLIGPELRAMFADDDADAGADAAPSDEQVLEVSLGIKRAIERVDKVLFPPVVRLETKEKAGERAGFDLGRAFFPSMFFMALFFMAQGIAEDLWTEKNQGALRRLVSAPRSLASVLLGKLLACVVAVVPVAIAGLALGVATFGLDASRMPLAILWLAASGGLFYALFAIIQVSASSERGASVLGNMLLFPLLMIGGAFFPFEVMPSWMVSIGGWTPNGWALLRFKDILDGKLDLAHVASSLAICVAATGALFAFALQRFQGAFARS